MMKKLLVFYEADCRLFKAVNRHFDKKCLNLFFRTITHIGGARFTIAAVLALMLFSSDKLRLTALSSALALSFSHLPVHFIKKTYPRQRPYIILENIHFPVNPLQDHSFPSGHTTAVFSVFVPFVLLIPALSFALIPLATLVGLSRVYLGLHYPSDVLAGGILGTASGILSYLFLL
ncbi:undecaprenyl-diphosphatase [Cytobacillus oceanisediminis]|uniref:Undecaprenyl-diphosphatase n=1 Tax=Cytobacillus oceanisediminis TaxID=665099 RepID=A0A2V2ZC98_9BACI|nr:phosphatase PAP2 family protein [Cytobacillus oceanisediminis]PWW17164.1 undecaprenyl-diphosphatase [Cytobacillus oceanisediminis]